MIARDRGGRRDHGVGHAAGPPAGLPAAAM